MCLYLSLIAFIKKLFFLTLLFAYVFVCEADVLSLVQEKINITSSFKAEFQQVSWNELLQQKTVAQGKLFYMKPGLLRWEYTQPNPQLIIVGEKNVWLYDPLLENVSVKVKEGINSPLLQIISGENTLYDNFILFSSSDNDNSTTELRLYPKKQSEELESIVLTVEKKDYRIIEISLYERSKNFRQFMFTDVSTNISLGKEKFVFEIPPHIEVIE